MNIALSGLQNNFCCLVYLDDIVIFLDSLVNHVKKFKDVYLIDSQNNLKLEPQKCNF